MILVLIFTFIMIIISLITFLTSKDDDKLIDDICSNLNLQIVLIPGREESFVIKRIDRETEEPYYFHRHDWNNNIKEIEKVLNIKPSFTLGGDNWFWSKENISKINERFVLYSSLSSAKKAIVDNFAGFAKGEDQLVIVGIDKNKSKSKISETKKTKNYSRNCNYF